MKFMATKKVKQLICFSTPLFLLFPGSKIQGPGFEVKKIWIRDKHQDPKHWSLGSDTGT
jgi:hypothetical protein